MTTPKPLTPEEEAAVAWTLDLHATEAEAGRPCIDRWTHVLLDAARQAPDTSGLLRDALVALETEASLHLYPADVPVSVADVMRRLRAALAATERFEGDAIARP